MNGIRAEQFLKFLQKLVEDAENEGKYISQKPEKRSLEKCYVVRN
jgi:hypothetical protein